MEPERIKKFLGVLIRYIKSEYYPILENIKSDKLYENIKNNPKSVTLHKSYEFIESLINENSNEKYTKYDDWVLFNFQTNKNTLDPEYVSLGAVYLFTIDRQNKKIIHEKSESNFDIDLIKSLKKGKWFLVKLAPFFEIRNAKKIIEKLRNNEFSKIDKFLLNNKQVSQNSSKIEADLSFYSNAMDQHQLIAFKEAINKELFYIFKGPPGTGKTHVIAHLINYFTDQGKNVIFASSLHSALDSLMIKFKAMETMKTKNIERATGKRKSIFINNDPKIINEKHGIVFVTTFASYKLNIYNDSSHIKNSILIVDETSRTSMFDILSKTGLANKLILVGDDAQYYPIFKANERKIFLQKELGEEYDFMKRESLFDLVYNFWQNDIQMLFNNYRSNATLLNKINFFYENKLKSKSKLEKEKIPIEIIKINNIHAFYNKIKTLLNKYKDKLCVTYYKKDVDQYNEKFKNSNFKTLSSIQGLENDYVIWVLSNSRLSPQKPEIDYRHVNVAISRARKKVYIIDYSTNTIFLTESHMIKAHENFATYKKKGLPYSIQKIINTQQ